MPKERQSSLSAHGQVFAPYPTTSSVSACLRNAAIWSTADDELLLQARGSQLSWQPIANKYFPNKSANACRKRHERLIERRHVEDWDARKLELLAQEYMEVRKEMWEILAARVGERWTTVEAKCMEKGVRTLQSTTRAAQRKASGGNGEPFADLAIPDHNSDSGIGLGSDVELESGQHVHHHRRHHHQGHHSRPSKASTWHAPSNDASEQRDEDRSLSLSHQLLPLYQPPPPPVPRKSSVARTAASPAIASFPRYSPEAGQARGGMSIQAVLLPPEPQFS